MGSKHFSTTSVQETQFSKRITHLIENVHIFLRCLFSAKAIAAVMLQCYLGSGKETLGDIEGSLILWGDDKGWTKRLTARTAMFCEILKIQYTIKHSFLFCFASMMINLASMNGVE